MSMNEAIRSTTLVIRDVLLFPTMKPKD